MLTDPQDDVPCRDCGALTQHASERCDDCRTPAGRLVAALAERGVRAKVDNRGYVRVAGPMSDLANVIASEQANALRQIADAIGCPPNVDPLTDLDGLVMAVRGLAERVVGVEARIADAVAADRMAAGTWLRSDPWRMAGHVASQIEHGDHINGDDPPLPSLRLVMAARDELLRQVER